MRLFEGQNHPTEQVLLAFADGELGRGDTKAVRKHLSACWDCRNRLRNMEEAILGFVNLRQEWAESKAENPRISPDRFGARLDEFEARMPPQRTVARWLVSVRQTAWFQPALRGAGVVALLVCIWYWLGIRDVTTVSASEFLDRADGQVLASLGDLSNPVVYRRVHFEQAVDGRTAETRSLRYWTETSGGRLHASGNEDTWGEISNVFRSNAMAGTAPLSVDSYRRWREAAPPDREEVTEGRWSDGDKTFSLEGSRAASGSPNEILAQELVVRASDWHPVQQTYRVLREPFEVELRFTEVAYDVMPKSALPDWVRAGLGELAGSDGRSEGIEPADGGVEPAHEEPEPPANRFTVAEVRVRYRLHQTGACLKDLVRVFPAGQGQIEVRGVVDTAERRRELVGALDELDLDDILRVDVRSVEEATRADELMEVLQGLRLTETEQSIRRQVGTEDRVIPAEELLRDYFRRYRPDEILTEDDGRTAMLRFADDAVLNAQVSVAEAAALRRLAARYAGDTVAAMNPASQAMLREMVSDHVSSLRKHLNTGERQLRPLSAMAGGGQDAGSQGRDTGNSEILPWATASEAEYENSLRLQHLVNSLFAGSKPGRPGNDAAFPDPRKAAAELGLTYERAQRLLESIERGVAARTTASAPTESNGAARE